MPKGKKRVSDEDKILLPDPSPEFGSVVHLSCTNDNPLQNVGFNVKICAFAIKWFLTEQN